MNYRHAFHAGNFADVVKHAMVARALALLMRKDAPLRYIDTHAGAGRYDLGAASAARTQEWRNGIGRLSRIPVPGAMAEPLRPYLSAVGDFAPDAPSSSYPGSPAIAQALLRRRDVLALCEKNPEEKLALEAALGRDSRLRIVCMDGYVALGAFVPPRERRGLVLIDPPFEAETERATLVAALGRALRKWPTGCFVVWRPIKDKAEDAKFLAELKAFGRPNVLNLEQDVGRAPPPAPSLRRAGLVIFNPPYGLYEDARALLAFLTPILACGDGAGSVCNWLAPPT